MLFDARDAVPPVVRIGRQVGAEEAGQSALGQERLIALRRDEAAALLAASHLAPELRVKPQGKVGGLAGREESAAVLERERGDEPLALGVPAAKDGRDKARLGLQEVERASLSAHRLAVQTDELARFIAVGDRGPLLAVRPQQVVGDDAVLARDLPREQGGVSRCRLGDGMRERHLREILALAAQAREPAVRRQPVDTLAQHPGGELIDYDGDRDGGVLPLGRRRDHAGNRGKSRRRNWNRRRSRNGSRSHRRGSRRGRRWGRLGRCWPPIRGQG